MAHHVCGKFRGGSAAVLEAPQKLDVLAALADADDAEVALGILFHVLEVLARTRDDEDLAFERGSVEVNFIDAHERDDALHFGEVEIFRDFFLFQQIANVAAVSLVPAEAVHIGGGFTHFAHEGRSQDIFHFLSSRMVFSYSEMVSK